MPLPARRIAHTSRKTHGPRHEPLTGKRPLHGHYNASDGTTDGKQGGTRRRGAVCLLTDTTTKRRRLHPPTRQRNAERHGELLPAPRHDNTGRTTGRGKREARRDEGRDEKKRAATAKREAARKTGRDIRLNEKITTRRRYRNPPANEENREDENDSTHTARASSQSPPGYHQSTKS